MGEANQRIDLEPTTQPPWAGQVRAKSKGF
jgi:hypothetical protein